MLAYVTRRVLYSIPVLLASSFLSFTFVSLAGDPLANLRQNPRVSQLTLHLLVHKYHLDASIPVRYWYWIQDVFEHKLGNSLITLQPIWPDITRTAGHTAQVVILAEVIALVLGIAVGIYSAVRQYSIFDYFFTSASFLGYAMPTFWLALLLQILFVDIYLHWHVRIFYTSGLNNHGNAAWSIDRLQHIALPVIGLTVVSFALYSRFMRASMLDVINADYVRTARAKGLPPRTVDMRHVLRNALLPVSTIVGLQVGLLLSGAILTETVFSYPGIGSWLQQAIQDRNYPVIQGGILFVAIIVVFVNLCVDISYALINPRIRLGGQ
jgi:peptide/nickel transport system permease protein